MLLSILVYFAGIAILRWRLAVAIRQELAVSWSEAFVLGAVIGKSARVKRLRRLVLAWIALMAIGILGAAIWLAATS
jgi:hypothetical protein